MVLVIPNHPRIYILQSGNFTMCNDKVLICTFMNNCSLASTLVLCTIYNQCRLMRGFNTHPYTRDKITFKNAEKQLNLSEHINCGLKRKS